MNFSAHRDESAQERDYQKTKQLRTVVGKYPDSCTVTYYESKLNLNRYREYQDQGHSVCFCAGEYDEYTNHYVISNTYIDDSCTEDRVRSTYQVRGFEEKRADKEPNLKIMHKNSHSSLLGNGFKVLYYYNLYSGHDWV